MWNIVILQYADYRHIMLYGIIWYYVMWNYLVLCYVDFHLFQYKLLDSNI